MNFFMAIQHESKLEDSFCTPSRHLSQSQSLPSSEACFPGADTVSLGQIACFTLSKVTEKKMKYCTSWVCCNMVIYTFLFKVFLICQDQRESC